MTRQWRWGVMGAAVAVEIAGVMIIKQVASPGGGGR
jgi:hypothetical protein